MNNNRIKISWFLIGIPIAVALLVLGGFRLARAGLQPEAWTEAEPIPEPLTGWPVQCPDQPESFYLVGGIESGNVTSNKVFSYDAGAIDPWTELAPMPQPLRAAALACYQGKIYVAGGWYSSVRNSLYIYDIASNTWSQGENLPDVVWGAFMGAWNGKLYLAGGTRQLDGYYQPVERVDVYDIAADSWTAGGGTPMLVATDFAGSVQAGPYLYIAGGVVGDGIHMYDETQRYNMATGDWELGPTLTIPQWAGGLAITGSRLYLLGGSDNIITWNPLDKVDVLELADWPGGAWTDLGDPLPQVNLYPATACTEAVAGGEIWATGGGPSLEMIYDTNLYRPAEACFDFYFGDLNPESQQGEGYWGGETVTYDLMLTNNGTLTDTYDLAISGNLWPTDAPATVGPLAPGESAQVAVTVEVPVGTPIGDSDSATLTATSQGDPVQADSSTLTTTAVTDWAEADPVPVPLGSNLVQCPDQPDSFYLVGGVLEGNITSNRLYRFDAYPPSGGWQQLADLPAARRGVAATCYQGKIYTAGGWDFGMFNDLYIYDIAGDEWTIGTHLPTVVWGAALGAWDGKLYLAGGTRINSPWTPVDRVDVYDIALGIWTVGGGRSMLTPASFFGAIQSGPYLYVVGGYSGDFNNNIDVTQRYDISTDTWDYGPDFTSQRALFSLAMTGTRLYAMGGDLNGGNETDFTDLVEYLDLAAWPDGAWTNLGDPLPQPLGNLNRGACTVAMTNGEIWSVGGVIDNQFSLVDDNLYRPTEPCVSFSVDLTPEGTSGEGYPGASVSYALTITNTGDITDYFSVAATGIWTVTVPAEIGPLGPGESAALAVSVAIPPGAAPGEWDTAVVTATSMSNPVEWDYSTLTTTAVEPGLLLAPTSLSGEGLPTQIVPYTLTLTNTGDLPDIYDLTFAGNTWEVGMPMTSTTLEASESTQVMVYVTVPMDAMAGDLDIATITATSQGDPDFSDSATLTTTALPVYDLDLGYVVNELSGYPGEMVAYTLMLGNTGNITDTYELTPSGNAWEVGIPVTTTTVAAGEMVEVIVYITVPMDAMAGDMDMVTITATSQGDPGKQAMSELTTTALWHSTYLPVIRQ